MEDVVYWIFSRPSQEAFPRRLLLTGDNALLIEFP